MMKQGSLSKNWDAKRLKRGISKIAKAEYEYYCEFAHRGTWKPARHLKIICNALERVERGKLKRLMIFMPPRHGKSMSTTETFPSWYLGRNPEKSVIETSYSASLAQRFGKANREKLREYGKSVFGVELSHEHAATTEFELHNHRGGMVSTGYGGSVTGKGADLLIIDDPIKNRQEAESPTFRNRIWTEYQNTLYTRLHPGGAVVLILTRWDEDDLAGRLLNSDYGAVEDWEIIKLPAICNDPENDLLQREIGETLWPEHGFDQAWAKTQKAAVGIYAWEALYQQRPSPPQDGIFRRDWFKRYNKLPYTFDQMLQSWDLAFEGSSTSDYVVGQVWGRLGPDWYLVDQMRGQLDFTQQIKAIRSMTAKYPQALQKRIEKAANGAAVISVLQREIQGITPVVPRGSKEVRAYAVTPLYEAGNVYHPSPSIAPWILEYEEELATFPNGTHDDQVDATTQALDAGAKRQRTWEIA